MKNLTRTELLNENEKAWKELELAENLERQHHDRSNHALISSIVKKIEKINALLGFEPLAEGTITTNFIVDSGRRFSL